MEDTTIEDALKTAEAQYIQQDYSGALKTLQEHQSNISPGVWHYNVGTIYGTLESYPLARYHLLQAEREGFTSPEALSNLEMIEAKMEVARLEKPLNTSDYLIKGSMIASEGILTSVALLILVIGLWSLRKERSFKSIGVLTSVVLLVLGLNWWIRSWPVSIVMKDQAIHEGPSAIFSAREELPAGVVIISDENNGWRKVLYPSRFKGWIKDENLKELK